MLTALWPEDVCGQALQGWWVTHAPLRILPWNLYKTQLACRIEVFLNTNSTLTTTRDHPCSSKNPQTTFPSLLFFEWSSVERSTVFHASESLTSLRCDVIPFASRVFNRSQVSSSVRSVTISRHANLYPPGLVKAGAQREMPTSLWRKLPQRRENLNTWFQKKWWDESGGLAAWSSDGDGTPSRNQPTAPSKVRRTGDYYPSIRSRCQPMDESAGEKLRCWKKKSLIRGQGCEVSTQREGRVVS